MLPNVISFVLKRTDDNETIKLFNEHIFFKVLLNVISFLVNENDHNRKIEQQTFFNGYIFKCSSL